MLEFSELNTGQRCAAGKFPSKHHLSTYTQTVSSDPNEPNHCECLGFTYRQSCKHVTQALASLCTWDSNLTIDTVQSPQEEMQMVCPMCGGDTEIYNV